MPVEADYLQWLGDEADRLEGHLRQVGHEVASLPPDHAAPVECARLAHAVEAVLPFLTEVAEALRALGRWQDSVPAVTGDSAEGLRRQALTMEEEAEEVGHRGD